MSSWSGAGVISQDYQNWPLRNRHQTHPRLGSLRFSNVFSSLPPILFSGCFGNLHELFLHMKYGLPRVQSGLHADETLYDNEEDPLPSLRVLSVTCQDKRLSSPPLSMFLHRCTDLENLNCHVSTRPRSVSWKPVFASRIYDSIPPMPIQYSCLPVNSGKDSLDSTTYRSTVALRTYRIRRRRICSPLAVLY